ncbi:hypothetical protein RND81_01G218700 [Saponaria officinalis]|uniref:Uncharacterized protein n=1 Tax=Saponaria officinalis TaxID=3572 RepID=A0AAW1N925_SAPOF
MDNQHLHHRLLSATSTPTSSTTTTPGIILRLLIIVFVGFVSIWANNEASRGFEIRVINDMRNTPVGDKFSLFYVYNDEATRLVQSATTSAAKVLYAETNSLPEKIIDQVDVRLVRYNLTRDYVLVTKTSDEKNRYVLSVSPVIMEYDDFKNRFRKEIRRGMAEVLLFDKRERIPKTLINGLVEYLSSQEGLDGPNTVSRSKNSDGRCWEDKDSKVVARFLGICEGKSRGFVERLYRYVDRDDWDDHAVDKALGMSATSLCQSFHNPIIKDDDPAAVESISTYR